MYLPQSIAPNTEHGHSILTLHFARHFVSALTLGLLWSPDMLTEQGQWHASAIFYNPHKLGFYGGGAEKLESKE